MSPNGGRTGRRGARPAQGGLKWARIPAPRLTCSTTPAARPMTFRILLAIVSLTIAGAPSIGRAEAPRPRLIVVVSVDQLAAEYLERFSPGFSDKGIFRL